MDHTRITLGVVATLTTIAYASLVSVLLGA